MRISEIWKDKIEFSKGLVTKQTKEKALEEQKIVLEKKIEDYDNTNYYITIY